MPIYEYLCEACHEQFEEYLAMSTKSAAAVPEVRLGRGRPEALSDQHGVAPERRRLGSCRPQLGLSPFLVTQRSSISDSPLR